MRDQATAQVIDAEYSTPVGVGLPALSPMVPAETTGEWISRESRIGVLVAETRSLLRNLVECHFAIGERLAELREATEHGRWLRILGELSIDEQFAQRHIRVFRQIRQFPSLKDLANGQFSRALTLIQSVDEETLGRIAQGEHDEISVDEIDGLSVRELKKRLRKLSGNVEHQVDRKTKVMERERKELIAERDRLAALAGDGLDDIRKSMSKASDQVNALVTQLTGIYRQLDAADREEVLSPRGRLLLDQIESLVQAVAIAGQGLWTHWMERRTQDWDGGQETITPKYA